MSPPDPWEDEYKGQWPRHLLKLDHLLVNQTTSEKHFWTSFYEFLCFLYSGKSVFNH